MHPVNCALAPATAGAYSRKKPTWQYRAVCSGHQVLPCHPAHASLHLQTLIVMGDKQKQDGRVRVNMVAQQGWKPMQCKECDDVSEPTRLTEARESCGAIVPKDMESAESGVPSYASGLRAGEALCELGSWVAADVSSAKGVPLSLREGVAFCCLCWPGRLMLR